tara:strand:- start:707 stop:1111 length:405 start_codon:yes stop_codon:yes gene_type:complete
MSDEQAMEIIENLSEELGEKELTIMKLEKSLEEQTKLLKQMTELCEIKQYKIDFMEEHGDNKFCPTWIILENTEVDDDLMIKVILHYFGGKIIHQSDIIKEYGDKRFWYEEGAIPGVDIEDLDNDTGNFWVCRR